MTTDIENKKEKEITKLYNPQIDLEVHGYISSYDSESSLEVSKSFQHNHNFFKNKEDAQSFMDEVIENPEDEFDVKHDIEQSVEFEQTSTDDINCEIEEVSILDLLKSRGFNYIKDNFPEYEIVGDLKLVLKEDKKEVSESNNSINQNQPTA